jgi:peptidyl-prolyl cis-trans isomerase C
VQTQFGWHVIRLEESRALEPPPFDAVREGLQRLVIQQKIMAYSDELMKNAKVEKRL